MCRLFFPVFRSVHFTVSALAAIDLILFSDAAARGASVHVPVHGLQPGLHGAGGGG
jgi:hypothetical protein